MKVQWLKKGIALVEVLALTACGTSFEIAQTDTVNNVDGATTQSSYKVSGHGSLVYDFSDEEKNMRLNKKQENLILMSMYDYYDSLGKGEVIEDRYLFTDDLHYREFAGAISLQIALRNLLPEDYGILDYQFLLRVTSCEEKDGVVQLEIEEDSIEHFIGFPYLDSERYSTYHWIEFVEVDGEWKLSRHVILDTLRYVLFGEIEYNGKNAEQYLEALPNYIDTMTVEYQNRMDAKEQGTYGRECDWYYDREKALQYALQYIDVRNEDWNDYSTFGGNCQNFASQCLDAGGIPMDTEGRYYWKYYGMGISNDSRKNGRSSSWTGVNAFVEYASKNEGYGLSAAVGYPFAWADSADLLIMGNETGWHHTTIVVQPVFDKQGNRVDYLIDCNTMNMKNYPALLYGYPKMIIVHINGWNGSTKDDSES